MKSWKRLKNCKSAGFTLAELLITVAIITILASVVTVAAVVMLRNMRQASSDKVAESLYSAVTTHLQEIYAFDHENAEKLKTAGSAVGDSKMRYVAVNGGTPADGVTSDNLTIVLGTDESVLGADYAKDNIVVEFNPSSLQVYSVFYSSKELTSAYYSGDNTNLPALRESASNRKDAYNGYLGYYHALTQDLPELKENEYVVEVGLKSENPAFADDELWHLRNMDELTVPVAVFVQEDELTNVNKLKIAVTLTGKKSGAKAVIEYDENTGGILKSYGNTGGVLKNTDRYGAKKMFAFELVLDNLEKGTFDTLFCENVASPITKYTTIRFSGEANDGTARYYEKTVPIARGVGGGGLPKPFEPGEDLEVEVTSVSVDGTAKLISDLGNNYAIDNSIFAYGSKLTTKDSKNVYAAYLAYGRHLQNLSTSDSSYNSGFDPGVSVFAYQVDNIDFTKLDKNYLTEHRWLWCDLYTANTTKPYEYENQKPFQPIINAKIAGFYGDYKLRYEKGTKTVSAYYDADAGYTINGVVIHSVENAGLFASFSGSETGREIKHITLSNSRISGTGITGGLIAKATLKEKESLTIEDCALYMTEAYCAEYNADSDPYGIKENADSGDSEVLDDSDVTGIWMSGKQYAGGLIGVCATEDAASDENIPLLTIKRSHASTVIDTKDSTAWSGGLIGYVGTKGASGKKVSVKMESCYTDSYLYGKNAGGLIGEIADGNPVEMKYVYTAGLLKGSNEAGFANGTIDTVNTSYAFTQMSLKNNANAYTTAKKITNKDDAVYYFPQNEADSTSTAQQVTNVTGTKNVEDTLQDNKKTIGELLLEKLNAHGDAFEEDPGDTHPYNLRGDMALNIYTKPRLKNMVHYGDWEEAFMSGALVYYEKYKRSDSVRFYGGNYNALFDNLQDGVAVAADGYGLVFKKGDASLPDTATVTYYFEGSTAGTTRDPINLKTTKPLEAEYGDVTYVIYPLATEDVNHVLPNTSSTDNPFYTKVEVTYKEGDNIISTEAFYFNPHFARAVGYLGRVKEGTTLTVPKLRDNTIIYLRSARHLYNLSLYYNYYREPTRDHTFRQTYDISYIDYDWNGYFNKNIPKDNFIVRQNPIGLSSDQSFVGKYNGGCYKIRDVSFVLESGKPSDPGKYYTGLFGFNAGELRNIVLYADYDETKASTAQIPVYSDTTSAQNHYYEPKNATVHYYAGTDENINKSSELHLGVLAGKNSGTITNCATAGYYLADDKGTIVGNSNGYIYAGGLTGENTGIVTNSATDTPFIRLTTNYATAYLGGFTGSNAGRIRNSYALGHIEVVNPRGGAIALAGFAARNSGELSTCYSAENIRAAGNSSVYAFSPVGGIVRDCRYLGIGTFSYVGHLYSYTFAGSPSEGKAADMEGLKGTPSVKTGNSDDYPKFKDGKDYPYRAVVTDGSGAYIHYGDWQRDPSLGNYGVFYWEKEEGSGNAGYHFSYVGVAGADSELANTTLCNAHDDKDLIVQYGYGYYEKESFSVTQNATGGLKVTGAHDADAAAALQSEVKGYRFYPYRTLKVDGSNAGDAICLDGDYTGSKDIRNGEWTLTGNDGTSKTFVVSPFFANAMSVKNPSASTASLLVVPSQDGINNTDYAKTPGSTDNPYEIRTIEQLQFINWNAPAKSASLLVEDNNYENFPYLAFAKITGRGKQTEANAGHKERMKFLQTHDVSGLDSAGDLVINNYTPIAASHSASSGNEYNAILYAWFGSDYDGQSYKIMNLRISSNAFSVGVFGVTASAGLKNIILYCDQKPTDQIDESKKILIERRNGTDTKPGGYSIGGLIGIAYKYDDAAAESNTIYNCAVAGYTIKDQSTNKQTQGESNIGGLIGATKVDVKNCSAVTDIEVNCTHTSGHSTWGDYVRAGGLIGALPGKAINCYSGGTIEVGEDTLAESRDSNDQPIDSTSETAICDRSKSMNVYIGGIAGSAFSMNYQNFTDKTGADDPPQQPDKFPLAKNCYSYVKFPAMQGTIRAITKIASLADRYCTTATNNTAFTIKNCYYYGKDIDVSNAAKCKLKTGEGHDGADSPYTMLNSTTNFDYYTGHSAGETYYQNMVRGAGAYVAKVFGYEDPFRHREGMDPDAQPTTLTYDQLANKAGNITGWDTNVTPHAMVQHGDGYIRDALNKGGDGDGTFAFVTVEQPGGGSIKGKYSFPGNIKELDGLNYPFPTIITQHDIVYNRTVNVHYGMWPLSGMYWSEARSDIEIFGDQDASGNAVKTLQVLDGPDPVAHPDQDLRIIEDGKYKFFKMEEEDPLNPLVEITNVSWNETTKKYDVTFRALKTGTQIVTVGGTAELVLEVKANFSIGTTPAAIDVSSASSPGTAPPSTAQLAFSASANPTTGTGTKHLETQAIWNVKIDPSDDGTETYYVGNISGQHEQTLPRGLSACTITGETPGRTQIVVKAVLTYNNVNYDASIYLPLHTYGVIGLSNNELSSMVSAAPFWNETSRAQSGGPVEGIDRDYGPALTKPTFSDDGWTDLYLYESYVDETLGNMQITRVEINGGGLDVTDDGTQPGYTISNYDVNIGSATTKLSTDGSYRYRSLHVRPTTSNLGVDSVPVALYVKDFENPQVIYKLSGSIKGTHAVAFEANAGDASDSVTLPHTIKYADTAGYVNLDDTAPTRTGYMFDGWAVDDPATAAVYCLPNDPNTWHIDGLNAEHTLYAVWTPIHYTVHYNFNGGELKSGGTALADQVTVYYDNDTQTTPECFHSKNAVNDNYEYTPQPAMRFVGWNTDQAGGGESYQPGVPIPNLTDTPDADIIVYAQWKDKIKLTFLDYKVQGSPWSAEVELPTGPDPYEIPGTMLPVPGEHALKYGSWGYYWTNASGVTYRFVGWDENRKQTPENTLYKVTYDLVSGTPSFPDPILPDDQNRNFYAIWEEVPYTIELIDTLNGTTTSYPGQSGKMKKLSELTGGTPYAPPICNGYTFVGWYSEPLSYDPQTQVSRGGSELADADTYGNGYLTKKLSELDTDQDAKVTFYARYSEDVYLLVPSSSALKNGQEYLVTITEDGDTVGDSTRNDWKKFGYLLRNTVSSDQNLDGVEHAFNDSANNFYYGKDGSKCRGSVLYMDTVSMPVRRTKQPNNIWRDILPDIPDQAVWIWEQGTDPNTPVGKLKHKQTGGYLYADDNAKLKVGPVAATQGIWEYAGKTSDPLLANDITGKTGYYLLQSMDKQGYYLHDNYYTFNLSNTKTPPTNNGYNDTRIEGNKKYRNRNFRVFFYEKTTVYLDTVPPLMP